MTQLTLLLIRVAEEFSLLLDTHLIPFMKVVRIVDDWIPNETASFAYKQ